MTRAAAVLRIACFLALMALTACENGTQNMYDQPKDKPLAASPLWEDGRASRPRVTDTVAFSAGSLADVSSGQRGAVPTDAGEVVFTRATLARGRERFGIYCAPCHGAAGDGDGYITLRGFPRPPTYHSDRLRRASDSYFFDVITRGYGAMYPYADRVAPQDRRAIVAYIRALQLSQHASISDVPAAERAQLSEAPAGKPR
jgi:mono/diheme cytochrome c family protein